LFLAGLSPQSYISWYLPVRKLVSSASVVAQYRTEEIPAAMAAFRALDYASHRMHKSGLLRGAIESHCWLIENSGRPLDSVFIEMNASIDMMMENLAADENKFNELTEYLFYLLARRSLFQSSEYLALKVLNEADVFAGRQAGDFAQVRLRSANGCPGGLVSGAGQQVNPLCHKNIRSFAANDIVGA